MRGFVVGLLICVVLTGVVVLVICGFCGVVVVHVDLFDWWRCTFDVCVLVSGACGCSGGVFCDVVEVALVYCCFNGSLLVLLLLLFELLFDVCSWLWLVWV